MIGLHALGALRVTRDGVDVPLGGPRQRRLLAVLLINRESVVSVDRVAEAVFAGAPTGAAGTTLRSYVARLRKVLGPAVVTEAPGYRLRVDGASFDVAAFEDHVARASGELDQHEPVAAAERLQSALALWNGDPYAEFADEEWVYPEAQRLGELRLTAEELLLDAQLARGRTAEVLPVLEGLRGAHPLREGFRSRLMTAYYRNGRQADALGEFQAFRRELADELGVDPSPALVELERRILTHDPALVADIVDVGPLRGYRLGERLGTGHDGTVHAARLPGVDRELVVKTFRREIADDPDFIRLFEATAHRVASLRHPGVVGVHDYWREPGAAHVVTPRVSGGTLRDRLRRGALARPDLVALLERVGGGLAAAASAGLAHGRVTADNVLYESPTEPVLADFWLGGPRPIPTLDQDVRDFAVLMGECFEAADVDSDEVRAVLASVDEVPPGRPVGVRVPDLVEKLLEARDAGRPAREPHPRVNPYRGLRAFEESDAANYFGREALVEDLLDRLSRDDDRGRLVLLVGASGTGKSSVVRAGLVPRVRAGARPGTEEWFVAPMFPGGSPFKELRESLRRVAPGDARPPDLDAGDDVEAIDRALRQCIPEAGQLVLVVDQFEELFTLTPEVEQRQFLAALTHALTTEDSRLRVVATLRADYYDRPLAVQPFGALVNDATVAIPAMLPAQLEAAIVEPAHRAGLEVDRALAAELVGSLATEPAGLPALQFVLYELAEHARGEVLSLDDYRELGGIDVAIASRAESSYLALDDPDRRRVRELFEQLVVVGPDGEPTRRRALRSELGESEAVVDRWVEARLLVLDVHPQSRMPTVEVAHEAILREWPRLRDWVEEDRADLVVRARLRESASSWAELGRDPSALYRGASLAAAAEVAGRGPALPELEASFVRAGIAEAEREQQEETQLIRRQARTNRRLRLQLGIIAVALVGALVGGFLALDQRGAAVQERHVATARELAAAADANLSDDPERSILLALAAIDATRRYDEAVLPEATEALHRAVSSTRVLMRVPNVGGALDWSPDGRLFTTEGEEETGILDVRNATTGRSVLRVRTDAVDLNDVAFSPESALVATAGDSSRVVVTDVRSGREISSFGVPDTGPVWGPSFSPDGTLVSAAWPDDGVARVVRTRTGALVSEIRMEGPQDTAFSPDGQKLAIAQVFGDRVHVHDPRSGRRLFTLEGEVRGPREVAWSPDGRFIAAAQAGADAARVYEGRTGEHLFDTQGHISSIAGLAWSPDSRLLATGSDDGTVRINRVRRGDAVTVLRLAAEDISNGARGLDFSPDGRRLMTGDWGITAVMIWDVSTDGAGELGTFSTGSAESRAAGVLTPDGREIYLATGDRRGIDRVDLATRRRTAHFAWPTGAFPDGRRLALSPDGRLLAVQSWDAPFPVYDTRTGRVAFMARPPEHAPPGDWPSNALDWSADGEQLAVVMDHAQDAAPPLVRIYDREGHVLADLQEEFDAFPTSVSLGPEGTVALTARGPRDDPAFLGVRLWDWRRGERLRRIDAQADVATLDPEGRSALIARFLRAQAEIWDVRSGKRRTELRGHTATVTGVAYSDDGRRVATASQDGSTRIWDARTGELEVVLRDPVPNTGGDVAFSTDGRRVVTTGRDGVVRIWALDLDELIDVAQAKLTRSLTAAECREYLHVDRCPGA